MGELHCEVLTPEGAVYRGEVSIVVAPAVDGEVGILPRHAPLITALGRGTLRLETAEGPRRWTLDGGFLEVLRDRVSVLAERAVADS